MDLLNNKRANKSLLKPSTNTWIKSIVFYLILIMLIISAILFNREFFLDVIKSTGQIPTWLFIVICLNGCLYHIIEGDVIYRLARRYQPNLKSSQGIKCALSGAFFQVATFGSGKGISKVYYLTGVGIPLANSIGICMVNYIFYKAAVILYGITAFVAFPKLRAAFLPYRLLIILGIFIGILINGMLIFITISKKLSTWLQYINRKFCKRHPKWLSRINLADEQISMLQKEATLIFRDKKLTIQLITQCILMQTIWYVIPYLIMQGKGLDLLTSIALTSIAYMLAGSVPLPSGYGSLDIIFTILLSCMIDTTRAASTMILFRFTTTFVPFFIGSIIVFLWKGKDQKHSIMP